MKILYVIDKAYPGGEVRYLIRYRQDGRVVANDIEDRMYAALLCEAFNLMGNLLLDHEVIDRKIAEFLIPASIKGAA